MTIPKITTDLAAGDPEATAKSRVISIVEGLLGANAFAGAAAPANWGGARAALNTAKVLAGVAQDDIFNNERGSSARAKINALNAARWWMDDLHLLDAVAPSYFLGMKSQKHVLAGKAAALASMLTVTNPSAIRRYFDQNGVLQLAAPNTPRISWSFGWPRLLLEGAATNKVTCRTANPSTVTNIVIGGDAAATLTIVDDVAALAAAGLSVVCSSGKVYKLDNSLGTTQAWAIDGGQCGNTNLHSLSVYVRGGAGSLKLSGTGNPILNFLGSAGYVRLKQDGATPAGSTRNWSIVVNAGQVIYFILPQLEEGVTVTSVIAKDSLSALTRTADLVQLPASVGALTAWAVRGYAPALLADQEFLGSTGGKYIGAGAAAASFVFDGSTVGAMTVAAAGLPGNVALCGGFGASGRRASQSGAAAVSDAITADRSRATMYLGGSGGLAPGQVLYLDELVGWALPDRPTAAGAQAQARAA